MTVWLDFFDTSKSVVIIPKDEVLILQSIRW